MTSVDKGIGNDFALIDVHPQREQYVNPSMAYFGGPTGAGSPQPGGVVEHAGHELVLGTGGTPRAGAVVYRGPGEGGDVAGTSIARMLRIAGKKLATAPNVPDPTL